METEETFDIYEEYGKERIRGDHLFGIAADLLKACELALHKIEQTLDGQYPDRAALRATIDPLRAAIAKAKVDA